jgi:hypothetical protein
MEYVPAIFNQFSFLLTPLALQQGSFAPSLFRNFSTTMSLSDSHWQPAADYGFSAAVGSQPSPWVSQVASLNSAPALSALTAGVLRLSCLFFSGEY